MSTTNPPAGPNNPGGDAPRPHEGQRPGAGRQWPADAADLSRPDDSGGGGGVDPAALRAGHEPDAFYVKPILSIPLAVVVTFVVAISVAAGTFAYVSRQAERSDPAAHPEAVARSGASINDRLDRVNRAGLDDDANNGKPGTRRGPREVDQPRLEPLRRLENDGMFFAQPPLKDGNSPELHADDIRPDRVAALQTAGYADKDRKTARIPIADAIRTAAADKGMFPVQKTQSRAIGTAVRPSMSSGGVGVQPAAPKAEAKPADAKKDEPKKAPEPAPAPKPTEKK